MIYKVYLINGADGILLLESTFKELKKIQGDVITGFFSAINKTIDVIQNSMSKGKSVNEMNRVLESEEATIIIYYHYLSKILFCSIADADDDVEKTKAVIYKIANRFWKKHESDLKIFRITTEKSRFQTFTADIENLTIGGRIAEVFPKLLIIKNVLEKVLTMGIITEFDFRVALFCNGENSPLKISRILNKSRVGIQDILKKLEQLDIIKI